MNLRSFSFVLFASLCVVVSSKSALAETFSDRVTHVRDGDTIVVGRRPIRLDALNCEEKRTQLGKVAKVAMTKLAKGKSVTCILDGGHTWDRETGRCSVEGRDLGQLMIESRLCGRCAAYDPEGSYIPAQKKAGPFKGTTPDYCRPS